MICNISQIEAWTSHLVSRAKEAREIGLLAESDELVLSNAVVFFPDGMDKKLLDSIQPNCPLREIQGKETSPGWVKRDDLFDDAAKWIFEKYSSLDRAELFCEAGYSKPGDKILESRPHVMLGDAPFLNQKLSKVSHKTIAKTLRWGRSWRLLGIVADMSSSRTFEGGDLARLLFLCDAFDGDSILLADIKPA